MATATSIDTTQMENAGTPESRVENLVTDDRAIYDELIAPMEATMMRCIWRVVRNADIAEDRLQDALAVIWKKRFQVRRHPNPPALILKICLDSAYNALRRLERVRRHTNLSRLDDVPADHRADRDLEERELEEQVQQAIRRLPRKRALALMMRLVHEEPFETIAQALGCSEVTVRIHISKGRAQLRKWLSPLCQSLRQEEENE
jgi:RNA polymerase sigma factor (sigma-70 family)